MDAVEYRPDPQAMLGLVFPVGDQIVIPISVIQPFGHLLLVRREVQVGIDSDEVGFLFGGDLEDHGSAHVKRLVPPEERDHGGSGDECQRRYFKQCDGHVESQTGESLNGEAEDLKGSDAFGEAVGLALVQDAVSGDLGQLENAFLDQGMDVAGPHGVLGAFFRHNGGASLLGDEVRARVQFDADTAHISVEPVHWLPPCQTERMHFRHFPCVTPLIEGDQRGEFGPYEGDAHPEYFPQQYSEFCRRSLGHVQTLDGKSTEEDGDECRPDQPECSSARGFADEMLHWLIAGSVHASRLSSRMNDLEGRKEV